MGWQASATSRKLPQRSNPCAEFRVTEGGDEIQQASNARSIEDEVQHCI